jgi:alanine racemase
LSSPPKIAPKVASSLATAEDDEPASDLRASIRPTEAEIDLGAIVRNRARLQAVVGQSQVWGVIKADAYGHGAVPVARALEPECPVLAVSLVEEGLELRAAGIACPIIVLGAHYGRCHLEVLDARLTPVIYDAADIEPFAAAARRRNRVLDVHVKIDTGMSRLGLSPAEFPAALTRLRQAGGLRLAGLCTHFASPELDDGSTRDAMGKFRPCIAEAVGRGAGAAPDVAAVLPTPASAPGSTERLWLHAANSAAAIRHPDTRLDAVRPGLALYGATPASSVVVPGLEPALRLSTRVMSIRTIPPGTAVSYGGQWVAGRPTRVATLPVGYADGYPRHVRGAEVLVRGRRCPVIGAVCMDMLMIDVTDVEVAGPAAVASGAVSVGDRVTLLGAQGAEAITVDELARAAGTINYEILCGISKRVPRVYKRTV